MTMKILFNLFSKYSIRILIFFVAYNYVIAPLNQGIKNIFFYSLIPYFFEGNIWAINILFINEKLHRSIYTIIILIKLAQLKELKKLFNSRFH